MSVSVSNMETEEPMAGAAAPVRRSLRRRVVGVLGWALLLSVTAHAAGTVAVMMTPPSDGAQSTRLLSALGERAVRVDERLFIEEIVPLGSEDSGAELAEDPAEDAAAQAATAEPVDEAPVRDVVVRRERTREPEVEPAVEPQERAPAVPVEQVATSRRDDAVAVVDAPSPAAEPEAPTDLVASASAAGAGPLRDGSTQGAGASSVASRGDGQLAGQPDGEDLAALRRQHVQRMNRALRSHQSCPRDLARERVSGVVLVGVVQGPDGGVTQARVLRSSGHSSLDSAAVDFVRSVRRLPRPDQLLVGEEYHLPLQFQCG